MTAVESDGCHSAAAPDRADLLKSLSAVRPPRTDKLAYLRFRAGVHGFDAPKCRVIGERPPFIRIDTDKLCVQGLKFSSIESRVRSSVRATAGSVLAASGIENPRLLLASFKPVTPRDWVTSIDNRWPFLMDHLPPDRPLKGPTISRGTVLASGCTASGGAAHPDMYSHVWSKQRMQERKLLHCAAYMSPSAPVRPLGMLSSGS